MGLFKTARVNPYGNVVRGNDLFRVQLVGVNQINCPIVSGLIGIWVCLGKTAGCCSPRGRVIVRGGRRRMAAKPEKIELDIRTAEIDDLAPVYHLGNRLFTSHEYSNLYRTWNEYEITSQFNQEPDNFLVADYDGQLAGFLIGSVIEKPRSAWSYGHLVWLGVEPDFARKRVASRLFERFKELMAEQGVRMLLVDTQADNDEALSFFKRQGFTNPVEHVYLTYTFPRKRQRRIGKRK